MSARDGWLDDLHPEAYRTLVEGVPAILYIDRPDELSTNLYTSPQIEPILGFSVTEWVADPELWRKQLHPDDRAQALDTHRRSNAAATPYLDEYRILTKDGRTLWIRDEAWPVLSEDGSILFWRGVMLDITERKEAEDKLRWSLDILRRTLQQRRELAQRLQHAQEIERRQIAADIHDDPIQVMSAVDMRLQMLQGFPESATPETLGELEREVAEAIERLRSLLFELRPTALERDGLVSALRLYLEHTATATGWSVSVLDELRSTPDRGHGRAPVPDRAGGGRQRAQARGGSVGPDRGRGGRRWHRGARDRRRAGLRARSPVRPGARTPRHLHDGGTCRARRGVGSGDQRAGQGTTVECWLPVDIASGDPDLARLSAAPEPND